LNTQEEAVMQSSAPLYGVVVSVRPTGHLTFRRMPSAILHISTYPFMPPSTMSGWLRRLFLLRAGVYPGTDVKQPEYYVMPHTYHVLGAYPWPDRTCYEIHTTQRHGVRAFNHNAFSRLAGSRGKKEVYQLHTWEYLLVEQLSGIVMSADPAALTRLQEVANWGAKCGKEGYAYVDAVSAVRPFTRVRATELPSVPATGQELLEVPADLYLGYRHVFANQLVTALEPDAVEPSEVEGYAAIWLGWPAAATELEYWTDGEHYVPSGMLEVF
jgi:hypothetical protein